MLFLPKDEKIMLLLYRIENERTKMLLGMYKNISTGEKKINKIKHRISKLGGDPTMELSIQ